MSKRLGDVVKLGICGYIEGVHTEGGTSHDRCTPAPRPLGPRRAPPLPGGPGQVGRPASDHRRFRNAVFGMLRTGAPWRDRLPDSGDGKHIHRRFRRGRDRGVGAALWAAVRDAPDCAALMIDASPIRVPPQAAGAQGDNQQMARTQGG